jgi:3-phenylpropionate/trans-cinnamate dioxygenase ferredoxin reductase subunit
VDDTIVIAGGGHAASELAICLRQEGHTGRIVLVGEEPWLPYQRPPLSKAYLSGQASRASLALRSREAYDRAGVELRLGSRVECIERATRQVVLADGTVLGYGQLALALGGRARALAVPGAAAAMVHTLRGIADIDRLRPAFVAGRRIVIIGGGYVGLEVAAVAVAAGLAVTLVEAAGRLLERVAAPAISAFCQRVHADAGVDIRTGVGVVSIERGPGDGALVCCSDGTRIEADLVVAGIGLVPNTELAAAAGLEVGDGILVDEFTRTSDPAIVAIGDCANHPNAHAGRRLRVESVQNALEMARCAAATLCGKRKPCHIVPWFWSDQYHLKLQMAGLARDDDQAVLRGSFESDSFIRLYLRAGRLVAVDAVNRPAEFLHARRLIGQGAAPDPARLADDSMALKAAVELAA